MMPAAKHFDPIIGVDVHIIQPPGPVPPVPIPHPHIGMVLDPFDYVPIIGATVMVNGVPRAQAGTAGVLVPPHIPIGGTFIKPPGNESEIFMGSATVAVDGDAFSYLALPVLSCQCIGMPPIPRLKKKSKTKSLVLPTSVVLPIPLGPPVLVGGPPTISLMALGMRVGMAALGKAFKKLSKTKAFKKVKGKADDFKGKFKKKKGKPASNKGSCEGGCPVDAITGAVVDWLLDFRLPGPIPFEWKRYYDSSWAAQDSPVGRGWRHHYQRTLEQIEDGFVFTDGTGEQYELPPIDSATGVSLWMGIELSKLDSNTVRLRRRGEPDMEFDLSSRGGSVPLSRLVAGACQAEMCYDRLGHLAAIQFSDGRLIQITCDIRGRVTDLQVARGGSHQTFAQYAYDERGTLLQHTDALGHSTTFTYDAQARLTCKRDALGYGISYAYDECGRCIRTWGQDGLYDERFEYHPELKQSIRRSANGAEWAFLYDENGTAVEIIDPYGDSRLFLLDDLGRVASDVDEIGQETQLLYDRWGGHYARQTPLGDLEPPRHVDLHPPDRPLLRLPRTPLGWCWGGLVRPERITTRPVPEDESPVPSASEVYDAMGRILERTDERGRTQRWSYDANGNPIEYVDADGHTHRTEISSWNLVRRQLDPEGGAVQYSYNLHEYVTKIVDPGGAASEYLYDLKDRLVEIRRHGVARESYRWDGAGNLVGKFDGQQRELLRLEIGPGGLPVKRTLASGQTHEFEYDQHGHVTRAATETSETLFARDGAGRVLADQRDGQGVEHTLAFGKVSESVLFGTFRVEFDFDMDGAVEITDPTGLVHTLRYGRDGRIRRSLSHGATETCVFDRDGHVLERALDRPGVAPALTTYRYSKAGDLLACEGANGVVSFEYDAAHRLICRITPDGKREEYRRDRAGNLLSKPGLVNVQLIEGNRLLSANGESFTYNERNHVASRLGPQGKIHYEYDSKDMLVQLTVDGEIWNAEYDALGRRIRKTFKGETTEFYWDDNRLAAEVYADGACRVYFYGDLEALVPFMFVDYDSTDAAPESGRVHHVFVDQRGCPEWVEDASGRTVWQAEVDPYGLAAIHPASEIEFNLRMPGHYLDPETGLHCNRFRYYCPQLGRYLQSDPIGQSGGYNLYAYCHNPLTEVDLVGWDHSNDLGGSKKSGDAESPSPAKVGDGDAVDAVAAKGGMDSGHLKNLQQHCADNNRMVVMRAGNDASVPHIKDPGGTPKPVECKLNTAKSGENAGKVTTGQSPQKWKPKSEGGSGYQDNLDQLKKDGYTVDNGVIKNSDGDYVHGDYDMQGVYDKNPDGSYGPPTKSDGTPYKDGTNDPDFQRDMNDSLNDPANYDGPDKDMVQHGANDDYRNPDGSPGRTPGSDENYVVVDENGTAHYVEGTDNLQQIYADKGIPWPY